MSGGCGSAAICSRPTNASSVTTPVRPVVKRGEEVALLAERHADPDVIHRVGRIVVPERVGAELSHGHGRPRLEQGIGHRGEQHSRHRIARAVPLARRHEIRRRVEQRIERVRRVRPGGPGVGLRACRGTEEVRHDGDVDVVAQVRDVRQIRPLVPGPQHDRERGPVGVRTPVDVVEVLQVLLDGTDLGRGDAQRQPDRRIEPPERVEHSRHQTVQSARAARTHEAQQMQPVDLVWVGLDVTRDARRDLVERRVVEIGQPVASLHLGVEQRRVDLVPVALAHGDPERVARAHERRLVARRERERDLVEAIRVDLVGAQIPPGGPHQVTSEPVQVLRDPAKPDRVGGEHHDTVGARARVRLEQELHGRRRRPRGHVLGANLDKHPERARHVLAQSRRSETAPGDLVQGRSPRVVPPPHESRVVDALDFRLPGKLHGTGQRCRPQRARQPGVERDIVPGQPGPRGDVRQTARRDEPGRARRVPLEPALRPRAVLPT